MEDIIMKNAELLKESYKNYAACKPDKQVSTKHVHLVDPDCWVGVDEYCYGELYDTSESIGED